MFRRPENGKAFLVKFGEDTGVELLFNGIGLAEDDRLLHLVHTGNDTVELCEGCINRTVQPGSDRVTHGRGDMIDAFGQDLPQAGRADAHDSIDIVIVEQGQDTLIGSGAFSDDVDRVAVRPERRQNFIDARDGFRGQRRHFKAQPQALIGSNDTDAAANDNDADSVAERQGLAAKGRTCVD